VTRRAGCGRVRATYELARPGRFEKERFSSPYRPHESDTSARREGEAGRAAIAGGLPTRYASSPERVQQHEPRVRLKALLRDGSTGDDRCPERGVVLERSEGTHSNCTGMRPRYDQADKKGARGIATDLTLFFSTLATSPAQPGRPLDGAPRPGRAKQRAGPTINGNRLASTMFQRTSARPGRSTAVGCRTVEARDMAAMVGQYRRQRRLERPIIATIERAGESTDRRARPESTLECRCRPEHRVGRQRSE